MEYKGQQEDYRSFKIHIPFHQMKGWRNRKKERLEQIWSLQNPNRNFYDLMLLLTPKRKIADWKQEPLGDLRDVCLRLDSVTHSEDTAGNGGSASGLYYLILLLHITSGICVSVAIFQDALVWTANTEEKN